jgi:hypothetical protein
MLQAQTVYGALHGLQVMCCCYDTEICCFSLSVLNVKILNIFLYIILQTFSQLCHFNFTTRIIEVPMVPWTVIDQPRFSFRGLLIGDLPFMYSLVVSLQFLMVDVFYLLSLRI